jgi:hypothetical protein
MQEFDDVNELDDGQSPKRAKNRKAFPNSFCNLFEKQNELKKRRRHTRNMQRQSSKRLGTLAGHLSPVLAKHADTHRLL